MVAELLLHVGGVVQEAIEATGELAGHLQGELGVGDEELVGVADLPDDGLDLGDHRGVAGLSEERPGLAHERPRRGVAVDGHAVGLGGEHPVDEHGHRVGVVALLVEHLARGQRPLREAFGVGQHVLEHVPILPPRRPRLVTSP